MIYLLALSLCVVYYSFSAQQSNSQCSPCIISLPAHHPSFYQELGHRIWKNESGCSIEKLVWWNEGESFMSLGIGHFIWLPENSTDVFTQTFPDLLRFMKNHKTVIPQWLEQADCPWKSRQQIIKGTDHRLQELRIFLHNTIPLQAQFIVHQFEKTCEALLQATPPAHQPRLKKKIALLSSTPQGLYALIDYVNFKGSGINEKEQYNNQGWGLMQVLIAMKSCQSAEEARQAFVVSAKKILTQRVENSPKQRNEQRWLPGWINRINTYL